jgi:hypothetical protein
MRHFQKFFFKFPAMLARPFCRYKIFGSEWDHDEQSKKIIIIDRLGFLELLILINTFKYPARLPRR